MAKKTKIKIKSGDFKSLSELATFVQVTGRGKVDLASVRKERRRLKKAS